MSFTLAWPATMVAWKTDWSVSLAVTCSGYPDPVQR